jgi:MFS family permease
MHQLKKANLARAFIVLRTLTLTLDYAKGFLLPLLVFQQSGGSLFAAGVAFAIEFLPKALLTPIFGSIVDRSVGKRLILIVEGLRVALVGVWAVLASLPSSWLLSSVISACSGLVFVFYEAAAAQRLQAADLRRFQVTTQVGEPLSRLAGPAAVGLLLLVMSAEGTLYVLTAGYLVAILLSAMWKEETQLIRRQSTSPWSVRGEAEGLASLSRNAPLLWLTVGTGFMNGFFGVFQSLLVPVMIGHYRVAESLSVLPNVVGGLFALIVFFAIPKTGESQSLHRFAYWGIASLAASAALTYWDGGPWAFALAFGLLILSSALYGVFFRAQRLALIPEAQRAQGLGATASILMLFLPLAGLVTMAGANSSALAVIALSGAVASVAMVIGTRKSSALEDDSALEGTKA